MTPFELAQRYVGIQEIGGTVDHPLIVWWLSLCGMGVASPDETPWCSAFVNGVAWTLRLPRSKSAAARSWLLCGVPKAKDLSDAEVGWDVVILKRGSGAQPGPETIAAPGHVGFYAGVEGDYVLVLGGNQSNSVSLAKFRRDDVLGVRSLA